MDNKALKKVVASVNGRKFPLKVEAENEAAVLEAIKELNSRINQYQLKFTNKPKEQILTMVLLTYAVDLQKALKDGTNTSSDFTAKLDEIDKVLDSAL